MTEERQPQGPRTVRCRLGQHSRCTRMVWRPYAVELLKSTACTCPCHAAAVVVVEEAAHD